MKRMKTYVTVLVVIFESFFSFQYNRVSKWDCLNKKIWSSADVGNQMTTMLKLCLKFSLKNQLVEAWY